MSNLNQSAPQSEANVPLKVVWLAFDDVDAPQLRHNLRRAIMQAQHRVRLDCREVDGAPNELIEILQEANEFAASSGKQITLAFASDHLRQALVQTNGRNRHGQLPKGSGGPTSAAMAAENSLKHRTDPKHRPSEPKAMGVPILLHASQVSRSVKLRRWLRQRAAMLVLIALGSALVIGIEWYLLPAEVESFVVKPVERPIKTFESGYELDQ